MFQLVLCVLIPLRCNESMPAKQEKQMYFQIFAVPKCTFVYLPPNLRQFTSQGQWALEDFHLIYPTICHVHYQINIGNFDFIINNNSRAHVVVKNPQQCPLIWTEAIFGHIQQQEGDHEQPNLGWRLALKYKGCLSYYFAQNTHHCCYDTL